MQKERIVTLFISMLLLLSLTTAVSAEENDYYLVANTTSDADGNFVFDDIPNGEYLIYAANYSYSGMAGAWLWYTGESSVEVNSSNVEDVGIKLSTSSGIGEDEIFSYLSKSSISGATYSGTMSGGKNYKISDVILVDKQTDELVVNTTSDADGNFVFDDIPNGEYLIYAANYSYSGMAGAWLWYTGESSVEVNSSNVEDVGVKLSTSSGIGEDEIFSYLSKSSISGATYSGTMSGGKNYRISDVILLKQKVAIEESNAPHLNISIVTGYSSYEEELANFSQRINANSDYNITANYYITTKLPENIDLSNMDIIYIKMVTQSASEFEDTLQEAIDNGALVIGQNTYLPESNYTLPSDYNTTTEFKEYLDDYWSGTLLDDTNLDNLIFYLAQEYYGRNDLDVSAPSVIDQAIYHPKMEDQPAAYLVTDADEYFSWYSNRTDGHAFDPDAPTVGITFYGSYYLDDMDPIDKLIEGFEEKGVNVISCYGDSSHPLDSYLNHSTETKVDAVVSFHYRGNYFDLEELGVPVMNAVLNGYMNTSEWIETGTPLPETNMLRIYGPETEGAIDPIMIGALETFVEGNSTVEKYIGNDEQIDWLIDRAIAQADLGTEDESDKKVVILYYNHGVERTTSVHHISRSCQVL
jgi:cobaltochelatase CobN